MDKDSFSLVGILIIVVLVSLSSSESTLAVQQQQQQNLDRPDNTAVAQVGLATRKILEQILTNYQNK
jgi:hypothetical protein